MALDTMGREFGEQGRVPDHVKSTRYVWGYGSDSMSWIEDLHPLLGEQKQHIQSRVTWSGTKLLIRNQAIGEEEGLLHKTVNFNLIDLKFDQVCH